MKMEKIGAFAAIAMAGALEPRHQYAICDMALELVGADELDAMLAGDDDVGDDDVGAGEAAPGRRVKIKNRKGKPRIRYWMLPMNSAATIATTASGSASNTPQQAFKPVRFVLANATQWTILNFTVANKPQTLNAGSIPGDTFQNTAVDVLLDCDTCGPAGTIFMSCTNNSASTLSFIGVFFGPTAQ